MTHDKTKDEMETRSENLDHDLRDWFVLRLVGDENNVAWYAGPSDSWKRNWFVFLNGKQIAGPFADVSSLTLEHGVLAWVAKHSNDQAWVHKMHLDGRWVDKEPKQIAGPFGYVPTITITPQGHVVFAAQTPGQTLGMEGHECQLVYRDDKQIGQHLEVNYPIRVLKEEVLYLAQDQCYGQDETPRWQLYRTGHGHGSDRFDRAFGLMVDGGSFYFVGQTGDTYHVVLGGHCLFQHQTEPYGFHYNGRHLTYVVKESADPGIHDVSIFCNSHRMGGPYEQATVRIVEGTIWALVRKVNNQYYLLRDGWEIAGPFRYASNLVVTETGHGVKAFYTAAKPGDDLFDLSWLVVNDQELGRVGSLYRGLQLLNDVPVVIYTAGCGADQAVHIADQRVGIYDRVSNPWLDDDGHIVFYVLDSGRLAKVHVQPQAMAA